MIRVLGLVLLAACGSKSSNDCGVKVEVGYLGTTELALRFENVSDGTVEIGAADEAAFSDASGTAMEVEHRTSQLDWFMPITLLPGAHATKVLSFTGDPQHVRHARIPVSPRCTVSLDFASDVPKRPISYLD